MKKKGLILLVTITVMLLLCNISYAYVLKDTYPGTHSLSYYQHSTLNSTFITAASSAKSTWNNASGDTTITQNSTTTYGAINPYDLYSEVAYVDFSDYSDYGVSSSAVGVCMTVGSSYTYFDILLDDNDSWQVNAPHYDSTGFDPQGVLTHEFGHAIGLGDTQSLYLEEGPPQEYHTPTMYYSVYYAPMGMNVTTDMRDLTPDDSDGKVYVDGLH